MYPEEPSYSNNTAKNAQPPQRALKRGPWTPRRFVCPTNARNVPGYDTVESVGHFLKVSLQLFFAIILMCDKWVSCRIPSWKSKFTVINISMTNELHVFMLYVCNNKIIRDQINRKQSTPNVTLFTILLDEFEA